MNYSDDKEKLIFWYVRLSKYNLFYVGVNLYYFTALWKLMNNAGFVIDVNEREDPVYSVMEDKI